MTIVRLLADDLTGTLDTAAELLGLCDGITVLWDAGAEVVRSAAFDAGTREQPAVAAVTAVGRWVDRLAEGAVAYKKVDSLLRGPWPAELAACWRSGHWRRCIMAPAFPFQGRRTRDGRQQARAADGSWSAVGADPVAALRQVGIEAVRARAASLPAAGVCVVDADTDDDLATIVRNAGPDGPILWCGSGGLARALAGSRATEPNTRIAGSVLGLFGSDQAATAAQIDACGALAFAVPDGSGETASRVARHLGRHGAGLVTVALPAGTDRADAARRIAVALGALSTRLAPPGTLIVAGGETLKALCLALGVRSLRVTGQVAPGLPRSVMVGGRWDGVPVVSKSGAFGPPGLWRDLLAANGLPLLRTDP